MAKSKEIKLSDSELKKIKNSGGELLPQSLRHSLETELNADFSDIRIHTGKNAKKATTKLNVQAFTHGNDIYFNSGKYQPHSTEGKRLLAHELIHVVQQRKGVQKIVEKGTEKAASANK